MSWTILPVLCSSRSSRPQGLTGLTVPFPPTAQPATRRTRAVKSLTVPIIHARRFCPLIPLRRTLSPMNARGIVLRRTIQVTYRCRSERPRKNSKFTPAYLERIFLIRDTAGLPVQRLQGMPLATPHMTLRSFDSARTNVEGRPGVRMRDREVPWYTYKDAWMKLAK
jgi:hypothetical protein